MTFQHTHQLNLPTYPSFIADNTRLTHQVMYVSREDVKGTVLSSHQHRVVLGTETPPMHFVRAQ